MQSENYIRVSYKRQVIFVKSGDGELGRAIQNTNPMYMVNHNEKCENGDWKIVLDDDEYDVQYENNIKSYIYNGMIVSQKDKTLWIKIPKNRDYETVLNSIDWLFEMARCGQI